MSAQDPLKQKLVRMALSEGFAAARVCRPDAVPEVPGRLEEFLSKGSARPDALDGAAGGVARESG